MSLFIDGPEAWSLILSRTEALEIVQKLTNELCRTATYGDRDCEISIAVESHIMVGAEGPDMGEVFSQLGLDEETP